MSEESNANANVPSGESTGGTALTYREMLLLFVLAAVQFTHIVDFLIIMPLGPIFHDEMGLLPWQFGSIVSAIVKRTWYVVRHAARL